MHSPKLVERPSKVEEAVAFLRAHGSSSRLVAGNTTLYELARQGAMEGVETLIDLNGLGLKYVIEESESLRIGSMTTFSDIVASKVFDVSGSYYGLKEAAGKISPIQIRNMGTIGGALCSGIPFYDMPTMVSALDSKLLIVDGSSNRRKVDIKDFLVDYFETSLAQDELLLEIEIPKIPHTGSSFLKLGRTSSDFAVVNTGVRVTLDQNGKRVVDSRIVLGAVGNTPVRAQQSEDILKGEVISDELILRTSRKAADFEPASSVHASSSYKKKVIPVLVRDGLLLAIKRANFNMENLGDYEN